MLLLLAATDRMSRTQIREGSFSEPLYPDIEVHTESDNPFALVAAVRLAMRQARIGRPEIERFTREALADHPAASRKVCRSWVAVKKSLRARGARTAL